MLNWLRGERASAAVSLGFSLAFALSFLFPGLVIVRRPPAARLRESDVRETPHRVSLVSLGNRVGLSGELWDDDRPDGRPHGDVHVS